MEHAQRVTSIIQGRDLSVCLNPYFNGTCSKRHVVRVAKMVVKSSLNPYFNGTCSKSSYPLKISINLSVLILILMEHAQRDGDKLIHAAGDYVS